MYTHNYICGNDVDKKRKSRTCRRCISHGAPASEALEYSSCTFGGNCKFQCVKCGLFANCKYK